MKLKILPPTLRTKNRYLVLEIKSELEFSKNELVLAIWDACIKFYGECETSKFNLWLMRLYNMPSPTWEQNLIDNEDNILVNDLDNNYNPSSDCIYQKAILKCRRNCENKVRASLAIMSNYKGKKIAINTVGISGTVSSSKHKFIN